MNAKLRHDRESCHQRYGSSSLELIVQTLRDNDVDIFFEAITNLSDKAILPLMLRCELRVEVVANLSLDAIDYRRSQLILRSGKGAKDRVVYISNVAANALAANLQGRVATKEQRKEVIRRHVNDQFLR